MEHNSSVTIALAMVLGLLTQSVAHHLRVPGIILLLFVGVCLGPDGIGLINPTSLGDGLHSLVGFAVAIILFEGGMCLQLDRIRREARSIRRLITLGAVITFVGGTLAARFLMPEWGWKISALFGSLVVVTGPTVVSPLLKRLKVKRSVSTVLEAEGVLIDAIGAIGAVVALEIAIQPTGQQLAEGAKNVFLGLGLGCLFGLIGGFLLTTILRFRNLIPEGLEKVFTLTATLALFQLSNHVVHESGIAAVTVAGMVVGNAHFHMLRDLHAFKEQLTLMLIGMLFILLAADVRIADVIALGLPGILVVLSLAVIVRPAAVFFSTRKSELNVKEKAFISWIGPRGIIAAAVASLFASKLEQAQLPGGTELRALVFLVIAMSVLMAGFTGGAVAKFLNLQRPRDQGWLFLGANPLAISIAKILEERGQATICIDSDPSYCAAAEAEGVRVLFGNGLEPRILKRAEVDTRMGAIGLTANEAVNLLFVKEAREASKVGYFATLLKTETTGITPDMVQNSGCQVLFGGWRNLQYWCNQIQAGRTDVQWWKWLPERKKSIPNYFVNSSIEQDWAIPAVCAQGSRVTPVDGKIRLKYGYEVAFIVRESKQEELHLLLNKEGWEPYSPEVIPLKRIQPSYEAVFDDAVEGSTPKGDPQIESAFPPSLNEMLGAPHPEMAPRVHVVEGREFSGSSTKLPNDKPRKESFDELPSEGFIETGETPPSLQLTKVNKETGETPQTVAQKSRDIESPPNRESEPKQHIPLPSSPTEIGTTPESLLADLPLFAGISSREEKYDGSPQRTSSQHRDEEKNED